MKNILFPKKRSGKGWIFIILGSFLAILSLLSFAPAQAATPAPVPGTTNPCRNIINGLVADGHMTVLPIIPNELSGLTSTGAVNTDPNACGPAHWDTGVVLYLAEKAFYFLNWLAGAFLIILIVYAGILYISGFASEANVKKAKSLIMGAITGFVIVFAAKYLVYGALTLFSSGTPIDTATSSSILPLRDQTPTP